MLTTIDPDLTLDGLRLLSLRNKPAPLPRDRARFIDAE
jgi:type III pantothenate kinase